MMTKRKRNTPNYDYSTDEEEPISKKKKRQEQESSDDDYQLDSSEEEYYSSDNELEYQSRIEKSVNEAARQQSWIAASPSAFFATRNDLPLGTQSPNSSGENSVNLNFADEDYIDEKDEPLAFEQFYEQANNDTANAPGSENNFATNKFNFWQENTTETEADNFIGYSHQMDQLL